MKHAGRPVNGNFLSDVRLPAPAILRIHSRVQVEQIFASHLEDWPAVPGAAVDEQPVLYIMYNDAL
jgi:hypothetical protein